MSAEATALILGLTDADQAEYAAAAHKTPAPEPEGEASTGAGQTPAADVEGASASGAQAPATEQKRCTREPARSVAGSPTWSAVDDTTADLLTLVAEQHPATPSEVDEWEHFQKVLAKVAAENDGLIDQNRTRPLLRGEIAPRRVGAFYHRATKAGLIRAEGWTTSDDREGKNSGRPCRAYVWLGAAS